jgi:uncharacterized phage protein gp47/JayE
LPYARPTLSTLIQQAQQDISSGDIAADGFLPRSILVTMAVLLAGFAWQHYDYQDWISLQSNPWDATGEFADGWGNLKGVPRKPATAAVLTVTFSGTNGYAIPVNTPCGLLNGTAFTVTTGGTVADDVATVTLTANTVGSASNTAVGAQVVLSNGISGISASSGIVTASEAGADVETDDAYKARYLAAYAAPPQGGDASDYQEWALAIPGVTRAWIAPLGMGAGTVVVYPMLDDARSAEAGFPQGTNGVASSETRDTAATGDQLLVANGIAPERPVTALVYATAPVAAPQNFTITGLGTANTTANQTAINAALTDMFLRLGNVGGTINPNTMAAYPAIEPSSWFDAISSVLGTQTFAVSSPSGPISPTTGQLPTFGTATFSS